MENAAEALKMAGAVLLFVLALSVAIVSFGQARETADTILDYRDRETFYIDGNYYYKATGTERTVGLDGPIYTLNLSGGKTIDKYTIDLETTKTGEIEVNNVSLANDEQKSEFLCGILYYDFTKFNGNKNAFEKKYNVTLPSSGSGLIERLKGKKITEYLGVYYQNDNEDVPDVNKTEKRIITYKIENR